MNRFTKGLARVLAEVTDKTVEPVGSAAGSVKSGLSSFRSELNEQGQSIDERKAIKQAAEALAEEILTGLELLIRNGDATTLEDWRSTAVAAIAKRDALVAAQKAAEKVAEEQANPTIVVPKGVKVVRAKATTTTAS